jgi:hypothetical protein
VAKALFQGMTRRGVRMSVRDENLKFDDKHLGPVTMTDLDKSDITLVAGAAELHGASRFRMQERCFEIGTQLRDFIQNDLPGRHAGRPVRFGWAQPRARLASNTTRIDARRLTAAFSSCAPAAITRALLKEITVGPHGRSRDRRHRRGAVMVSGDGGDRRTARAGRSAYTGWPSFRCGVGGVIWDLNTKALRDSMAWEKFNPNLAAHDLVQDMKWDPKLRQQFKDTRRRCSTLSAAPGGAQGDRRARLRTLYDLGMHPLSSAGSFRASSGATTAGKGAVEASNNLVASLQVTCRDHSQDLTFAAARIGPVVLTLHNLRCTKIDLH